MSAKLLGKALAAEMPTHVAKLILLALCDAAEPDGTSVYPSVGRVAKFAQCSARQVKRTLATFREAIFAGDRHLIEVVRQGGAGPGSTTEYAINVGLLDDLEELGWHQVIRALPPDAAPEPGDNGEAKGDTEKGDTVSPLKGDVSGEKGDAGAAKGDAIESPDPSDINPPSRPVERGRAREPGKSGAQPGGQAVDDGELLEKLRRQSVTAALDSRVDTDRAWSELNPTERVNAVERYPAWLALAQKGGRKIIAGLPSYLRERRFDFVDQPKGQAAGGEAEAPAVFFDAFSRPWWHLVHGFLAANRDRLGDVRGPAARELKRLAELAAMGIGYRLKKPEKKAELEAAAEADLVAARKSDPAVKAWIAEWQRQGVRVPLPDQVEWVFMPRAILDRLAPAQQVESGNGHGNQADQ